MQQYVAGCLLLTGSLVQIYILTAPLSPALVIVHHTAVAPWQTAVKLDIFIESGQSYSKS